MSRVLAVVLLAGLAFAAMFASWPAGGASSPAGPTPTPTASAGTVATVAIDTNTAGNAAGTVGPIDTCISVPNGSTFIIDVVMVGLPAGQQLFGVNYDIDYNPAVVQLGNDDDGDGRFDEDTGAGNGDEDSDGEAGEEGTSGGGTIGHDPGFVLMGATDWSQGNEHDGPPASATSAGTWSDFSFTFFKLSDYPTGPRDGTLNRITVRAVGAGVSTLNLRDLYGTQDANSPPTLVASSGAHFTIGNGGNGDATIAVDTACQTGCMTYTATPTASPTPWPSPPWTPYAYVPICNDTGQAVSDLHVRLIRSAANEDPIGANAPGCPEPAYFFDSSPSYTTIDIDWGTPCVQPGEMITLYFYAGCTTPEPGCSPPHASCFYWTLDGAPVPSASPAVNPPTCANASPIPTASAPPPGTCAPRGTPPGPPPPSVTPVPVSPIPGSTSRDVSFLGTVSFCNDTGEPVSDLHALFAFPYSWFNLAANPFGCPEPSIEPEKPALDEYRFDVDWGADCVDAGELITVDFYYLCGDTPCIAPQPHCYTWTRFSAPVYQGQGDCVLPTPTPTPTPPPGTPVTFTNNTGVTASGLHFFAAGPMFLGVSVVENAEGCAWANGRADHTTLGPDFTFEVNVQFSGECVDDGESVTLSLDCVRPELGCGEAFVLGNCADWTVAGTIVGTPCPTPDCGGVPCCNGLPCPTPPIDVTVWTFPNDTGQTASDLHASFTWPFNARLVENAPGCPEPSLVLHGPDNSFDLDWGVPCVDPGESVDVEITSEPPALPRCFYWTLFGQPIASSGGGCQWSGDTNCSRTVDSADALRVLAIVAGFAVPQEVCASADVDCDGDEDAVDALKILRYVAGMSYTQHEPCPDIGSPES